MSTSELKGSDVYQPPAANVVGQFGDFDESSMFSPSGRAGRLRYFGYLMGTSFLLLFLIGVVSGISAAILGESDATTTVIIQVTILGYVAMFIITFLFMIKRLHDMDRSGWLSLLSLVPLINFIFGLFLLFAPGTPGPNNYGPPPKPGNNAIAIIVISLAFVAIIGILAAIAIPAYQDYATRSQQAQQNQ